MRRVGFLYIIKEIIPPSGVGIIVFTFTLLIQRILKLMDLIINKGVSPIDVAKIFLYFLPPFLVLTIPMSFLLGILVGFSRLSQDSEVVAMKASGLSVFHMLIPVSAVSLVCSIITAIIMFNFLPWGNYSLRKLLYEIGRERLELSLSERTFNDDFDDLVIYVDFIPVRDGAMKGILVADRSQGEEGMLLLAREAVVLSSPDKFSTTLRLVDVNSHQIDKDGSNYKLGSYRSLDRRLDLAGKRAENLLLRNRDLTFMELRRRIAEERAASRPVASMLVEMHSRVAIPFACFIFALLGMPLALYSPRSTKSVGFPVSIMIFVLYYVMQEGAEVLGDAGRIPPILAAWAPNLILGAVGAYFFARAARDRPVSVVERMRDGFDTLMEKLKPQAGRIGGP
ncbi:LPS export ABC transporter permease LptF [Thermodesulfobacteriota bacterium]